MKLSPLNILLLAVCGVSIAACSSTPETTQATAQRDTVAVEQPAMAFETSTDTVSSEQPEQVGAPQDSMLEPLLRYGVQIGAYKDPQNATRAQVLARERFQMPVMNDFHADSALYHVRIGSFAVKDSAYSFRSMMQRQYLQDYKDSWIVQFLKQP